MNTHADKAQENKSQLAANAVSQKKSGGESSFQFVGNRPEAIAQRKLQEMANNSPHVKQLRAFQEMADNSPQVKQAAQLQAMADNNSVQQQQPIQKKENNTGFTDNLKTGMENLSGMSLDDVKVHRNSDKPAQLQAHAYAQGMDIHLGPGQEKHLPHEAWHVVQQKQGRVKPTMQMKGKVNVNDNAGLEKEADVMGEKAVKPISNNRTTQLNQKNSRVNIVQRAGEYSQAAEQLDKKKRMDAAAKERLANESERDIEPQENEGKVITARKLVERLVSISEKCAGGSRVLRLDRKLYPWVNSMQGEDKEWLDGILEEDITNSNLLLIELNYFANLNIQTLPNRLSSVLSNPPIDLFVGGDFSTWANSTRNGSCGEGAAGDCAIWALHLSQKIPGIGDPSGKINAAKAHGDEEQKKWNILKTNAEQAAAQLSLPPDQKKQNGYVYLDVAREYLEKLYKMNPDKPVVILAKEWKAIRKEYHDFWKTDEDYSKKPFMTWAEARKKY